MIVRELITLKIFVEKHLKKRKKLKNKELLQLMKLLNKFNIPIVVYKGIVAIFSDNKEILSTIKENIDEFMDLNTRILDREAENVYDLEYGEELTIKLKYYVLLIGKFELKKRKILEQKDKRKVKEYIPPYVYT